KIKPQGAEGYYMVAMFLNDEDKIQLHDGRQMNRREAFFEAIKLEPKNWKYYAELSETLAPDETIKLPNRPPMNKHDLLAEAKKIERMHFLELISWYPESPEPYKRLAKKLLPNESIQLIDGRLMNKEALLQEAEKSLKNP